MATRKHEVPPKRGERPQPGEKERRPNSKPGQGKKVAGDAAEEGACANEPTPEQRAARQAEALRQAIFPSCMAVALGLDGQVGPSGYRAYLAQLLKDTGDPTDPIEHMLTEQLALAHFRIAQLHADAGQARGVEAAKIYNSLAARMLGEFRRTALALRVYRTRLPEGKPAERLKVFKMAQ